MVCRPQSNTSDLCEVIDVLNRELRDEGLDGNRAMLQMPPRPLPRRVVERL